MSNEVQISVRTLVEYVLREGSIDSHFLSQSTLLDGTRIHQKIQKTYHDTDQKEVYLRTEIPYKDLTFIIEGRCDGLLFHDGEVVIDEIKSFSQVYRQAHGRRISCSLGTSKNVCVYLFKRPRVRRKLRYN